MLVRKMNKKEHTSACNRLGFNAFQFARRIYQPHIILYICGLCANSNHIYLVADGAKLHHGLKNKKDCGYV